jgi:hypothetical protein
MLSRVNRRIGICGGFRVYAVAAAVLMLAASGGDGPPSLASPLPSSSPRPAGIALNGIVREAGTTRGLSGARLVVTTGPDAGTTAVSDGTGAFIFPSLSPGAIDLEGRKAGYLAAKFTSASISPDTVVDVALYAIPPRDAAGVPAAARCNDASWSWSQAPARACANRGGVATVYVRAR